MSDSLAPLEFRVLDLGKSGSIKVPIFGDDLPPNKCSTYARLSAEIMFGIKYPQVGTKSMRKHPDIGTIPVTNANFYGFARDKIITPGMIVGVHFEKNRFNDGVSPYAHLALYVGEASRTPLFIEQLGRHYRILTMRDYDEQSFDVREALHLKSS